MHPSVREIRPRLLSLLVGAFIFVIFLTLIFFLFVVSYFLTIANITISMPFIGSCKDIISGTELGWN